MLNQAVLLKPRMLVDMKKSKPGRNELTTSEFVFDYTSAFDYSSIHRMTKLKPEVDKYKTIFHYNEQHIAVDIDVESEPEPCQSAIIRTFVTIICYLLMVVTFPLTFWMCIKRVPSLERLAVFRLGKLQPVQGPGLVVVFPFVDSYTKVDLKPKVFCLPPKELLSADGAILEISAELQCQVVHSVRYVTRVREVDTTVKSLCQQCLATVINNNEQEDIEKHKIVMQNTMLTKLNESIIPWGLEVINVDMRLGKIVKQAEPVSAITPVVSALKSAFGFTEPDRFQQAFLQPSTNGDVLHAVSAVPEETQYSQIIQILYQLAAFGTQRKDFQDLSAVYKIDILGNGDKRTVHLCFKNGTVDIREGEKVNVKPDVSLQITANDLTSVLCGKESPLQVYTAGRIKVSGDWSYLKKFMEVIQEGTS